MLSSISMGFQMMMLSFMKLCMFVLEEKTIGIQSLFENEQCYGMLQNSIRRGRAEVYSGSYGL